MNKLAIKISCGIGDAHTYSARLPALCYKRNVNKVDFYIVGGYKGILKKIKELLSLSPYVRNVYLSSVYRDTGDVRYGGWLDWRSDNAPLEYDIQYPYITPYRSEDLEEVSSYLEGKPYPIVIQPYSVGGNERGTIERVMRSAEESWWVNLLNRLIAFGTTPIIVGAEYDAVDWKSYGVEVETFYGRYLETIPLILNSSAFVGTNSWCWQVAYYAGIRTSCLYIYPQQHLRLHLAKQLDNLTIFKVKPSVDRIIESLNLEVVV